MTVEKSRKLPVDVVNGNPFRTAVASVYLAHQAFDEPEIYFVAHSEGTVVTFNSLVQAAMVREGVALHPDERF